MKRLAPVLPAPFLYGDFQRALRAFKTALGREPVYGLLLGESGTGKTTLLRLLADELDPRRFQVLYLCHGQPSPSSLVRILAEALHLPLRRSRAEMSRLLVQTLKHLPTRLVFCLDEALLLADESLQELRLLAEADLQGPPLFSVLLSGLPVLKDRLLSPQLFPLWRRLAPRATLTGLTQEEVAPFLKHRLDPAQVARFSPDALSLLFEQCRAIPALLEAAARQCLLGNPKGEITPHLVGQCAEPADTP